MKTTVRSADAKDDLLVSWKDIAAYLKCSVRKAQRLEQRELPVNRIRGTKSVWASKSDIDQWLATHSEKNRAETATHSVSNARLLSGRAQRWLAILFCAFAALTVISAAASRYGVTIALFGMAAVSLILSYPLFPDTIIVRTIAGLFVVAGMAYCTTATSLPETVGSIVNMSVLRPAIAYSIVAGLRFIPVLILNCLSLTLIPRLRRKQVYLFLSGLLLLSGATALLMNSGVQHVWHAGLPIRWTLLTGESFVIGVNGALAVLGYRQIAGKARYRIPQLLSWHAIAYLLIALTAAIVTRHWNDIDKYHLDIRYPAAYRAHNADPAGAFRDWYAQHGAEVSADCLSLFNDAEFLTALQSQNFYKQNFDERLQSRAVIFGYRAGTEAQREPRAFTRIRFPVSLAAALGFERTP